MKRIVFFVLLITELFSVSLNAQTIKAADKLYAQGVTYMKTLTVASQKKAISSFEKAKIAYDTKNKKALCDEQILACKNIIQKLTTPKPKAEPEPELEEEPDVNQDTVKIEEVPVIPEISIVVNPTSIEVPAKGGKYVEISVKCNNDDWKIISCPEWISYTTASDKILLKPERNKEKSERAGVITITCGNKKAELIVKQAKPGFFS